MFPDGYFDLQGTKRAVKQNDDGMELEYNERYRYHSSLPELHAFRER